MIQTTVFAMNSAVSEESVPNSLCTASTSQICNEPRIKVYKRRIWMLFLYIILGTFSSMLFAQFVSMANVTGCYYGVSQSAVNWTVEVYLLIYVVFVVPISFVMNYIGLRWSLICGSFLNTISCGLQFLTLKTDEFICVIISNVVGSVGSVFILGLGPYVVAKWFPSHELSRACAFANFGNEIGVSVGLIFTPLMMSSNCTQTSLIEEGKRNIAYILTCLNAILLILFVFTFQNAPPIPPNIAQLDKKENNAPKQTMSEIFGMLKSVEYLFVCLLTGLMGGSFYAFTTIANNLFIRYFPQQEVEIATMTTVFTLVGILGSVVAGYILDYTHKFKETAILYCSMSLVFYIALSCVLPQKIFWVQYLTVIGYGFFQAAFLIIGLEYAIEVSFPASEMISTNLQFFSTQLCGLIILQITSHLLDIYGPIYTHTAMGMVLSICIILAIFSTRNYKRNRRNNERQSSENQN